ncbi:MAG TPA: GGDEF domain-containing protein [Terriglobales bacterium]|nr:GGDEF domain-containing protein [Terriglobales bacterium]
MLTYAIGYVQSVQFICFALVLGAMALQDRENEALRWLALGYGMGTLGAIIGFLAAWEPRWLVLGFANLAAPLGYACFNICVVRLVGRGRATIWVSAGLIAAAAPLFLHWADFHHLSPSATLGDGLLALITTMSAWLLASSRDRETRAPRLVMAGFLGAYAVVEYARVVVYVHTGKMTAMAAPAVEYASGFVYVVSCSLLPLAFIWMTNVRLHNHLNRLTLRDPLTDLLNRRGVEAAVAEELARYRRRRHDLALVLMDLDDFKRHNDAYGHPAGDAALREAARFLTAETWPGQVTARLGGEEFILLLPDCGKSEAAAFVERLRERFSQLRFTAGGAPVSLTASFGVAVSHGREELSWETLISEADSALYEAKGAGRNRVCLYQWAPPVMT